MKKTKTDFGTIIYIASFFIILLGIITSIVLFYTKPNAIKEFEDIPTVTSDNWLKKNSEDVETYIVVIYQDGNPENEELKDTLISYAEYARKTKKSTPLYVLNYGSDPINSEIVEKIDTSSFVDNTDLPYLINVKDGAVSSSNKKSTVSAIKEYLINLSRVVPTETEEE